jgi:signal transduction histidine kinase
VKSDTNLLLVSASSADAEVLGRLLADDVAGSDLALISAPDARRFFAAFYAEEQFQVIVIDDRCGWSDWRELASLCRKHRPNALLVIFSEPDETLLNAEDSLGEGIAAVYPRGSAGLLALARLVTTLSAQRDQFSLRMEGGDVAANADDFPDEDREKLVYAVSHDLQDPLQLARRYADILNEDYDSALGDSGAKVLGHLQFNLGRTQEMLDELLDYSRLQTSRQEFEPVDLNELLDEVIALYRLTLQEVGGTIDKQHELPTLVVDKRQFQRLFQNLVGNAIKFRSERPLEISVRAQRVGNEWRIGVKDNGIGIAEDDVQRIFGMFERAGDIEHHAGTGMGLAICKRIVANHGGRLWARSSLGEGSVFIFSIPQGDEGAIDLTE